jgi:DNA-directed RNA polymerase omega subunit
MSKPIELSRGPKIDTESCVENIGNRFNLVLVAATRAREIKRSHSTSDKREHIHSNVTALLEIQEGKIGKEYLKRVK